MMRMVLSMLLCLAVSGCTGSAEMTRFYVLAPADVSGGPMAPAPAGDRDVRVGIRSVELPRYLERPQIVTRASATRLEVAEFHQWSAPLRQAVPVTLAENLARMVPTDQVVIFPWGRSFAPDVQVVIDISRLEGVLGGESVLAARWRVLSRAGVEIVTGTARLSQPSGADYESLVAAQSRLLAALSREIAAAVRSGAQATYR